MLPVSVGASEVLDARAVRAERSCHTRPQKFGIFFIPFGWFYYTGCFHLELGALADCPGSKFGTAPVPNETQAVL